jgi:hypothetical protein
VYGFDRVNRSINRTSFALNSPAPGTSHSLVPFNRRESLSISHETVLGWQGFGEAERQIRRRFQQKYKQSSHTLADTGLANGSFAHPREHTKAVAQHYAQDSRDSRTIAQQKQRGAEQATMSLDSL